MVNWKWMQIYQNAILKDTPAVSSDQCASILETQPLVRIKKEFRFEAFWAEHEECKEVIKRSWHLDDGNRSCWNQFVKKRNRCKRELTEWSRRKFKRADKEIERKKTELQHIQNLINRRDHFVWPYRSDGEYFVRTCYHNTKEKKDAIEENRLSKASTTQNMRKVWETIWRLPVPQKRETGKEEEKILCKLGCVCWCIWKERNQHIFQQSKVQPEKIIFTSEHLAAEFYNAIEKINNENRLGAGRSTEKKRVT
ncbi:hypothetical protein Ahy_A08g039348 isoform B [Arachis hypogaea]|uniref:Uncharacterized protein n=1 Tax=Arachis hypogaea TaxID=3818 RepID=A0A445BW16_ARAHY|nr:hypothetical protein Ahy_A08g039348 isoform B [Arachis hypogaea]